MQVKAELAQLAGGICIRFFLNIIIVITVFFRSLSALGNQNPSVLPLHPGGIPAPRCWWQLMAVGHKPWGQEAVCPPSSISAL